MHKHILTLRGWLMALALGCACSLPAQMPGDFPPDGGPPAGGGFPGAGFGGPPGFGPGGFGPGGPGGMQQEIELVSQFDKNGDGWLNSEERKAARASLAQGGQRGAGGPGGRRGGFGGPRGFGGPGEDQAAPQPGRKLSPADVQSFPDAPLYASNVVRTFFLEFENADWEKELADFKNTDVEVPAKLTVDGKTYPGVGVHFHGSSSYMMIGEGRKRSLVVSLDFIHRDQRLGGYRKVVLLNSHEDPSFLRTVLSLQIAREYMPAPRANHARVVINGESWGLYVNQQHFNQDFLKEAFGATKGARWKVPGSPNGRGGLDYLGDDPASYRRIYEIKSKDEPKAWTNLINLCKVLAQTPPDQLEKALTPLLDVDAALKFFAWDNVLVNGDGVWTRASDYNLYLNEKGRFHIIPYDANETFSARGGPGGPGGFGGPMGQGGMGGRPGMAGGLDPATQIMAQADRNKDQKVDKSEFLAAAGTLFDRMDVNKAGRLGEEDIRMGLGAVLPRPQFAMAGGRRGPRGPGGGGVNLDPLVSVGDSSKPIIAKLLAVPALRTRYLAYVREMADRWLDWKRLGPIAQEYHALIAEEVKADTRKLDSFEAFQNSLSGDTPTEGFRGPGRGISLRQFAEPRRAYLLQRSAQTPKAN